MSLIGALCYGERLVLWLLATVVQTCLSRPLLAAARAATIGRYFAVSGDMQERASLLQTRSWSVTKVAIGCGVTQACDQSAGNQSVFFVRDRRAPKIFSFDGLDDLLANGWCPAHVCRQFERSGRASGCLVVAPSFGIRLPFHLLRALTYERAEPSDQPSAIG